LAYNKKSNFISPIAVFCALKPAQWDLFWKLYTGEAHIKYGWNIHLLKELTPTLLSDDIILNNLQKCIDDKLTIEVKYNSYIFIFNIFISNLILYLRG
jgi:hypothetical protein